MKISSDYVKVNDHIRQAHWPCPRDFDSSRQKRRVFLPTDHINKLEYLLPQVRKVLVIGWRATEADFLNMLESRLKEPQLSAEF